MGARPYAKVVWSEGMHLAQHHFQAQSRYLESTASFALSGLSFRPYGFLHVSLDKEAIREGTVSVLEARGVMPDGLAFEFPQGDPPPPDLEAVENAEPGGGPVTVCLAIPAFQAGRANCDSEAEIPVRASERRYRPQAVPVQDENTGEDRRELLLASKNFRLLVESELTEDLVALPLAQVRRGPGGSFEYVPDYVPPSLHIGAMPRLPSLLEGLVQMLSSKARVLAQRRLLVGDDLSDLSSEEVLSYWMSHSIHSGLAGLRHLQVLPRCHPEDLFREIARLAGALSTFSTEVDPENLPQYDHDDLTGCFKKMEKAIRKLLQVMVPESFIPVKLESEDSNVLSAVLEDARVFRKAEWVLQVSSETGGSEVLRSVPTLVKVCSAEDIRRLVDDANPGLPLEHVPSPPAAIPRRLGAHYFRCVQSGPCWQLIQSRSSIGVYVPDVLSDLRVQLIVVQA